MLVALRIDLQPGSDPRQCECRRHLALQAAKPGPLDLDLATVKTDLALAFPRAVRPPIMTPRMTWTIDRSRIVIDYLAKGLAIY